MLGIDAGDNWAWDLAHSGLLQASAKAVGGEDLGVGKGCRSIPIQSPDISVRTRGLVGIRRWGVGGGEWAVQPKGCSGSEL